MEEELKQEIKQARKVRMNFIHVSTQHNRKGRSRGSEEYTVEKLVILPTLGSVLFQVSDFALF
jgi:hypothetical protein